ncbi:hypothetical protein F5Y11DRAFT_311088 [Daldinia sp. FL1419]|nr:hypothetical protein F5Y11DRAFT_311088 [Daldinia sp. FL1419]
MATKCFAPMMLTGGVLEQMSGMDNVSSTASLASEFTSASHLVGSSTGLSGSYTTAAVGGWATSVPTEPSTASSVMANGTWTTTGKPIGTPIGTGGVMPSVISGG